MDKNKFELADKQHYSSNDVNEVTQNLRKTLNELVTEDPNTEG